jgi:hypothetical protein
LNEQVPPLKTIPANFSVGTSGSSASKAIRLGGEAMKIADGGVVFPTVHTTKMN